MKKNDFPVSSHPVRIKFGPRDLEREGLGWTEEDFENNFGIARVLISPPRDLLHPILPIHSRKKTIFALCQKCADTDEQEECTHDETERAILVSRKRTNV